eukprot:Pgem_evm1s18122
MLSVEKTLDSGATITTSKMKSEATLVGENPQSNEVKKNREELQYLNLCEKLITE